MLPLWVSVVAATALAAPAPGTREQKLQVAQAPNVVLVASDSFDGRLTFQPGSRVVKLPFINFMKAHGTTFLNAYTNSPICCPSRAAMWSGLFTHLTESWNNFKGLDPNYTTWMDVMEKHGYQTQKFGKLDYTSGHHSVSNRVEAWTRDVAFLLRQEGRPVVNLIPDKNRRRVMERDWQNTDKAIDWLRQEAINYTKPFVLYLGLNLPHPYPSPSSGENFGSSTFHTSLYWLEKVAYDVIKIPKWSALSEMHPVDYYSSYTKNCTGNFTKMEIKNIRAFYYAMCAETDAMLGEIILALRKLDLLQKTIVIYTSDHGEMAMEHRQFYKMSMYEASAHVPLLMMGPGIKVNLQVPDFVSLVDIYPTMLGVYGHTCATVYMWRSENNFWELSLSFHHVSPRNQTQVVRTTRPVPLLTRPLLCPDCDPKETTEDLRYRMQKQGLFLFVYKPRAGKLNPKHSLKVTVRPGGACFFFVWLAF
ncbi:arylsulfatase K isoform X3 [Peromyscus californicus insignis]|uniref:arylsulfatase K isoform X3 n=1 Tax=Peromyscus californicus insignis TaxID=564181 RepID=UPI0022A6EB61|nr:arylsulfatase K isoform X3 [Peromyscus californicus insignis]